MGELGRERGDEVGYLSKRRLMSFFHENIGTMNRKTFARSLAWTRK